MLSPLQRPYPYLASELDFHRERITEEFAEAELRRRVKAARRARRLERARRQGQRRNAPRTA
jgi:hypothetical protein